MRQKSPCPKCRKKAGWSREFEAKEIRAYDAKGGMLGSDWVNTMIIGSDTLKCRNCRHDITERITDL